MKLYEDEDRVDSSVSKSERRVKIDLNHTWMLRLLPVKVGSDNQHYVRLAQHWWNKSPMYCPRYLSQSWGGNPDYACPVCSASERLLESSVETIRDIGYESRVQLRRKMWCVVFDMEDAHSRRDTMSLDEVLNPYSIEMSKTTWEDFKKMQNWALNRRKTQGSDLGILDLETGCNILAMQTKKGVRLDRQDSEPIFDINDPDWDNKIGQIWSRIRKPVIVIPTDDQLIQLAMKIEEAADGSGSRKSRGRGRNRGDEDEGGNNGGSRGGWRGGSGGGRGRNAEDEDEPNERQFRNRRTGEDDDEDNSETQPASRRSSAKPDDTEHESEHVSGASSPPPRRSATRQQEQAEKPENEAQEEAPQPPRKTSGVSGPPPARQRQTEAVSQEEMSRDQEPPPLRRNAPTVSGPPPARKQAPAAPAEKEDNDNDNDLGPQKPPARRAASGPPAEQATGVDDDEDNAPAEAHDPAPTLRETVVEETPPPVSASVPPPRRASASMQSTSDLQSRLNKVSQKPQI